MTDPLLVRFLPVVAVVVGGAGILFLLLTPVLRRREALWREIGLRIVTWAAIATGLLGALALGRTTWIVVVGLLSLLVFREYARAVGLWTDRAVMAVGYLFLVAVTITVWWPYADFFPGPGWYGLFLVMPVWGIVALMLVPVVRGRHERMLQKTALAILGMVYFGFFLAHAGYLVNLGHGGTGLVLFLAFLVAVNDVAAFIAGKLFGRHKLRPGLSPGKTWEGALGSMLVVAAVAWALRWLVPVYPHWSAPLLGALISIGAVVGDLTTSTIKRDVGIKDWSQVVPGHGGILDRANSLVYTAPVFFHLTVYLHGL